ncbi:4Fe-4S binding protein [Chloroflexota bacterium]
MPGKIALIDFNKCRPEECEKGICKATKACNHKLLMQDTAYEIPMTDPSICRGCGDCLRACPLKAIQISKY